MVKDKRGGIVYYVEVNGSICYLETNDNIRDVRWNARQEWGSDNLTTVRQATQDDIDYIGGMGGWVPELEQQEAA